MAGTGIKRAKIRKGDQVVVIAGRGEPVPAVVAAHVTWIVVSQLPLVALAVAITLRRHDRAVTWLRDGVAHPLVTDSRGALSEVQSPADAGKPAQTLWRADLDA